MKYLLPKTTLRGAFVLIVAAALAFAPAFVAAKPTGSFTPGNRRVQYTVRPDGSIQGPKTLKITITRMDKPTGIMQSCGKVESIRIKNFDFSQPLTIYGSANLKHPLCSFTKTVSYKPFSDTDIKAACIGSDHQLSRDFMIDFWAWETIQRGYFEPEMLHFNVRADVSCPTPARPPSSVSGRYGAPALKSVNRCNFSGVWPVWPTSSDKHLDVPFALVSNHGHSDYYEVRTPNAAGVVGSAVVTYDDVVLSLQSGGQPGKLLTVTGLLSRACSAFSGAAVRSESPVALSVLTHRRLTGTSANSGNANTRSVRHASGRKSVGIPNHVVVPRTQTHVTPNWNQRLR